MHPDPVRRERVMGYSEEAQVFGVFDPLFAPSPATVPQVQQLGLVGGVGDRGSDPSAFDVGDTQLAARRGVLHLDDDPGVGWDIGEVDAVLPGCAGGQQSGDVGDIGGVGIGHPAVGAGS